VTSSPWLLALRMEIATRLPRLVPAGEAGIVFEDRNANGRRDPGEPGVLVTRGPETAVTGATGRFSFSTTSYGAPNLDSRSLPDGWLPGKRQGTGRNITFPLVPVAPVEVRLVLDTRDAARIQPEELASVLVGARGVSQPLRLDGEAPTFVVGEEKTLTIDLVLKGRALNIRRRETTPSAPSPEGQ
jgi:hypothetical protein